MKKIALLMMLLVIVPTFAFAVSNAKMNGQKEIVITRLPAELVFTCDLAQAGNKLAFEYYVDLDMNGRLDPQEDITEFFYVTDGIGWIRDPANPEDDFAGDETGLDGKLQVTFTVEQEDVFIPIGMNGILKLVDEDGSTDMVKVTMQVAPQPPFIQGKITDKNTGTPLSEIFVVAERQEDTRWAISDVNGNYKVPVTNGTYHVIASQYPMTEYMASDTISITIANDQSVTQDFQLEPFPSFVQGKLTRADGTPVPGIVVVAIGGSYMASFFSMATSDDQGNYKLGAKPGTVAISPGSLYNEFNDNWPQDHYPEPEVDSINVVSGQTYTSNFVFKPYTSFITGSCTANGNPLSGVLITGISYDLQTLTVNYYRTYSSTDGSYRLGVKPGIIALLTAEKTGYTLTSPQGGYVQVTVLADQTITGKDFSFTPAGMTSIAGRVTFSDGSPAPDVYVAAENSFEESPEGFLITYTDGNGHYLFENLLEGDYKVGVYRAGYWSDPAMRYFYLLWGTQMSGQDFVLTTETGVEMAVHSLKPKTIRLGQNFPNPFNPTTAISFYLPQPSEVEIVIFNAAGQKIRTLIRGNYGKGHHQIQWDGRDETGQPVSSGVYLYQLKTSNYHKTMKMILAR